MIRDICQDQYIKAFLQKKISTMLKTDISKDFDYIINNTSDLEFYAYYHNLFVKSPFYKIFDINKMEYQKKLYERKFETIKNMVNIKGKYILDVGQEDGYYSKLYNERGAKMEGINVSLTMNYKGDKSNIKIYDGTNIPFEDGTFDIVVIHMVLHHVMSGWKELLKDIYRVLKKGGILIVEDHDFKQDRNNKLIDVVHCLYEMVESVEYNVDYYNNYEIRRFKKEELLNELKKIGFVGPKLDIARFSYLNSYYLTIRKN
jgi:SAM-dependent methyltransferase